MKIAILKETAPNESRVAGSPEIVKKLTDSGAEVCVQSGAGLHSSISDAEFKDAGATIASDVASTLSNADIVLKVQRPSDDELSHINEGSILVGTFFARFDPDFVESLNKKNIRGFSLDGVPRIARAQKMDVLSSQSNIAGYKAVIVAADRLKKMMPLMMTAAGTVTPAKVLVLGAGVAGLQAIATAKRLGAVVEAFDTRPVVKEQVESLGGKFLQLEVDESATEDAGGYAKELDEDSHKKELELVAKHSREADIVITTALIPGKPAPLLVTKETVAEMREGSVIVDLAAETGGNCELTKKGEEIVEQGVTLVGTLNLPSLVSENATQLYARNLLNFLQEIIKDNTLAIDYDDEVVQGALVTDLETAKKGS